MAQGAEVGIALANSEGLWWENPLDVAAVERSPLAKLFLEEFLTLP